MLLAISTITDRDSDNFLSVTQRRQYRLLSKDKTTCRPVLMSALIFHISYLHPKIAPAACLVLRFCQVDEPLDTVKDNFY